MKKVMTIFFLCLAACSRQNFVQTFSKQEQALAIQTADDFHDGRTSEITSKADVQIRPSLAAFMGRVQPLLSQIPKPYRIQAVRYVRLSNGLTATAFLLVGGAGQHWALVTVVLSDHSGATQLAGLNVQFFSDDPVLANSFRSNQRGAIGWLFVALMACCTTVCLSAVVLIWRYRWLNRRWLWTFGSLWGFFGFALNWTTGAWGVGFNISFLGFGATKAGIFSPWLLSFSIPVVAILVIHRWFQRLRIARASFD